MPSLAKTLTRGVLAGAVGTAVMTAAQTAYLKSRDEEPSSAPGEVGRRIYGLARAYRRPGALTDGTRFGALVWGASLIELPAMGLAPPVWEYPREQLASDAGFHLVYGVGVAGAFAALDR